MNGMDIGHKRTVTKRFPWAIKWIHHTSCSNLNFFSIDCSNKNTCFFHHRLDLAFHEHDLHTTHQCKAAATKKYETHAEHKFKIITWRVGTQTDNSFWTFLHNKQHFGFMPFGARNISFASKMLAFLWLLINRLVAKRNKTGLPSNGFILLFLFLKKHSNQSSIREMDKLWLNLNLKSSMDSVVWLKSSGVCRWVGVWTSLHLIEYSNRSSVSGLSIWWSSSR